ncbi:MAG: ATP-binding cassette domain-containing protein [Pseudonocardiales bacterium]
MTTPAIPRALRGRRRITFGVLVTIGVGHAVTAVAWSLVISSLVNGLTTPGTTGLALRAIELIGLALVSASLVAVERVLAEHLGQSWINEIRVLLFGHVARTPVREHRHSTGATTLRFVGDLTALRRWASLGVAKLAVAVPLVVGCLVALVLVSPLVAVAAGAVVVAGLGATLASTAKLRATSRVARQRRARVAAHVTEHVGQRLVMQAFGRADAERRRVRSAGRSLARAMIRRAHAVGLVRGIGEATTLLATAAALLAAVSGGVSAGAAAAAIAVVAVLATPLRDLSRVAEYRAGAVVATQKITEVLARPVRPRPAQPAPPLPAGAGKLELDCVTMEGVFGPLSVTAEPGEVVALVGPNGAGKSTLLTVLAGLVHPDKGRVLLDGADVHAVAEEDIRHVVGLVTPDLPLLRGTIVANIRYANPDADDQALHDVIDRAELDEVLADLPDGLNTRVGEGGAGLSAGQRQRVALARALLTGPRVLLLDEADAHLDPAAASVIDRVIAGFAGTVIVVTHRPERLTEARTTWRLAGGRLQVAWRPHANATWGAR